MQVAPSPTASQHFNGEGGVNDSCSDNYDSGGDENNQEIEETCKITKQGQELLQDMLEEVSNKRQRRKGLVRYVLLAT